MTIRDLRRRGCCWSVAAAMPLALAAGSAVLAQELGPFEPRGLRTESVSLFPSIGFTQAYNDNALAVPDDSPLNQGDFVTIVRPALRAELNTRRHSLFARGGAALGRFEDLDGQNYDDWEVAVGGRWDATRTFVVNGQLEISNDHESADDPDRTAEQLFDTTEIDRVNARVSLQKRWRRGLIRFTSTYLRDEFDDVSSGVFADADALAAGTPTDRVNVNEGRDVSRLRNVLRVAYRPDRDYNLFTDVRFVKNSFDRNRRSLRRWSNIDNPANPIGTFGAGIGAPSITGAAACSGGVLNGVFVGGDPSRPLTLEDCGSLQQSNRRDLDRDFNTVGVLFGTNLDFDRLVTGELSAGLERVFYADDEREDGFGFTFEADLDWTLSTRTGLNIVGEQGFRPTGGGDSTLATDLTAGLSYALSPQASVGADLGFGRDDRQDSGRVDQTYTGGLSASYAFNRHLTVGARYSYEQRTSTEAAREFSRNTMFLTVVGRY